MIRVQAWNQFVSPKFYSPLANWPWLRVSPQNSLNIIYCLIFTAWQWLMSFTVFLCKLNPIKAHWGTCSWPYSFERSATFPSQEDHVLVDLFLSVADGGGGSLCGQSTPTRRQFIYFFKSSPEDIFIDLRERESERERERYQSVASHIGPNQGSNP